MKAVMKMKPELRDEQLYAKLCEDKNTAKNNQNYWSLAEIEKLRALTKEHGKNFKILTTAFAGDRSQRQIQTKLLYLKAFMIRHPESRDEELFVKLCANSNVKKAKKDPNTNSVQFSDTEDEEKEENGQESYCGDDSKLESSEHSKNQPEPQADDAIQHEVKTKQ